MITITFRISNPDEFQRLNMWFAENHHDVGMTVVLGSYSGFVDYAEYLQQDAIMFTLVWGHIITGSLET